MRACLRDQIRQDVRVLQHRAGTVHIVVERLSVMICHKQRTAERIQQRLLTDIGIRIVDEDIRIDIPVRVDVQISASAGDAAANISSVILEVHHEQRVVVTELINASVHFDSLLRSRKQGYIRVISR